MDTYFTKALTLLSIALVIGLFNLIKQHQTKQSKDTTITYLTVVVALIIICIIEANT